MKKLNWNSVVKVKLTEYGKEIYRSQYDALNERQEARGHCTYDRPEPVEDKDGFVSFQLWCFMQLYGLHIGMAMPPVVTEINFYIDDGELEEVTLNVRL